MHHLLAYIPSPPVNGMKILGVKLHIYGLCIALGIVAAVWMAQRRWREMGGAEGVLASVAVWGVPGGLIGARLYSLATSWGVDVGSHWIRAFEVWDGGLGIWGGIVGGILTGLWGAHRKGLPGKALLDCAAAGFPLAQAIGRWGNYFNQELFGLPSKLPWAVKIDHAKVLTQVPDPKYWKYSTFQPTFLYECIWDIATFFLVMAVWRSGKLKRGWLVLAYTAFYTFGRFFTEYLRIDEAHRFWGLRLNDWTSIILFVVSAALVLLFGRAKPGQVRVGDPLPAGSNGVAPTRLEEHSPDDSEGSGEVGQRDPAATSGDSVAPT